MPREALIEGLADTQQSLLLSALVCLNRDNAIGSRKCVGETPEVPSVISQFRARNSLYNPGYYSPAGT